jgi:hypothetical protein
VAQFSKILKIAALILISASIGAGLMHILDQRKVRLNYEASTSIRSMMLMNQINLSDRQAYSELRDSLQQDLDCDICILGIFARKQDKASVSARWQLKRIRDHRKDHPYQSTSADFQHLVDSALSLAD